MKNEKEFFFKWYTGLKDRYKTVEFKLLLFFIIFFIFFIDNSFKQVII